MLCVHSFCQITSKIYSYKRHKWLGGPQLSNVYIVFFYHPHIVLILFFISWNFFSTCPSTTKNVNFMVLTLDSFISTNITYQLVPKITRHAPVHIACRRPIGRLRKSLHHIQIRHRRYHWKMMSLWMQLCQNRRPIGIIWASLHNLRFAQGKCHRRKMSLWIRRCWNCRPIVSLRPYINNLWFLQIIFHSIKDPFMNSLYQELWPKEPADWAVAQSKRRNFRRIMFIRIQTQLKPCQKLARIYKWNISTSSRENYARMNPFQTNITTRTKGTRYFLRRYKIEEWQIWSTISNNLKPRHNIRHEMTNLSLTTVRKIFTYWKRWWNMNVSTGGRKCIIWRRSWLRQWIIKLILRQRLDVMLYLKYLKFNLRCIQRLRR